MPKKADKSKGKKIGKGAKGEGGGKGKKKGGKKKVKAKLSEDAKNRQQEQRAAVEEERRRLREELVNSFLRHKLQKEQYLTRLNQSKLIEKWRHILRESKSQELTKELEMMKLDFDKRFSENNHEISRLMEALVQSGLDFVHLSKGHKKATAETYSEHMSRLAVLEDLYEQERTLLESTVAADYNRAEEYHDKHKAALLDTVQSLQAHYHQSYVDQRSHFQIRKDEIINQGLEEVQTIKQLLERRLERKWQQFHEVCVENGELDEQRWALYSQLERNDRLARSRQTSAAARLDQLSSLVARMQLQKQHEGADGLGAGPSKLLEERNELHDRRERWRVKLIRQQSKHLERLKAVAASSSDAAEHLEQLARQGVLILRSAQRCLLLKPSDRRQRGRPSIRTTSTGSSSLSTEGMGPTEPFQNFWTRFNRAYLETVLLQRHRAFLARSKTALAAQKEEETALIPGRWALNGHTLPIHPEK